MEQHAGQNANEREVEDVDDDRGIHCQSAQVEKCAWRRRAESNELPCACMHVCMCFCEWTHTSASCVTEQSERVEAETKWLKINFCILRLKEEMSFPQGGGSSLPLTPSWTFASWVVTGLEVGGAGESPDRLLISGARKKTIIIFLYRAGNSHSCSILTHTQTQTDRKMVLLHTPNSHRAISVSQGRTYLMQVWHQRASNELHPFYSLSVRERESEGKRRRDDITESLP